MKLLVATSIVIFLSSCMATHCGYMTTDGALGKANFVYVRSNVEGVATATYFLGIGGVAKETLIGEAKQHLPYLANNQTFVNLTVNFKTTHWFPFGLLVNTVTCTITADIVEFSDQ